MIETRANKQPAGLPATPLDAPQPAGLPMWLREVLADARQQLESLPDWMITEETKMEIARLSGSVKLKLKRWWVRWYDADITAFEYHGPWWISGEVVGAFGESDDETTHIVVAAVLAKDPVAAKAVIAAAHDNGPDGIREWSFVNERADNWEPFCDRFPRTDWMKWPTPTTPRDMPGKPSRR